MKRARLSASIPTHDVAQRTARRKETKIRARHAPLPPPPRAEEEERRAARGCWCRCRVLQAYDVEAATGRATLAAQTPIALDPSDATEQARPRARAPEPIQKKPSPPSAAARPPSGVLTQEAI